MRPKSVTVASTLITFSLLLVGYGAFLVFSGRQAEFMLSVIESPLVFVPHMFWPMLWEGGVTGLAVSLLILIGHVILATLFTMVIGIFMGRRLFPMPDITPKEPKPTPERLGIRGKGMKVTVKSPDTVDPVTGGARKGYSLGFLYDDTQMRVDRSNVKSNRPPKNAVEELEFALLAILHRHQDWTCDPAGNHSTVGLYEHSLGVASRMRENTSHHLCTVIGLAHDIGKLLAYQRKGEQQWKSISKIHDKLSGELVRHLAEFWALDPADQRTVSRVLSYSHSDDLPANSSAEVRELITALKIADGLSTADDRATSQKALETESVQQTILDALVPILGRLNINNYEGKRLADGWTIEGVDYVAVLESRLRELIAQRLPHRTAQLLQANVPIESNRNHPMITALADAFRTLELLKTKVPNGEADPISDFSGLFDMKVGKIPFRDVFLLKKDQLVENHGADIRRWGSAGFRLRVIPSYRSGESANSSQPTQ